MTRPLIIGLTGSIGMGKSTVAAMFEAAGVPVFDADAEVRAMQGPGGELVAAIEHAFPGTTDESGVSREMLGALVFGNAAQLARLESIVHPAVAQKRQAFMIEHSGAPVVVFDIPLLFVLFIMLYITYLKDIQIILNEYQNSESSSNLNILSNNSSNQRKMNFIIYSGSHNVNLLGATKSTDIMLVKNLKKLGYNIVWVGRGEVDISICKYHNIGTNKIFEFAIRGYNKFKRIVFSTSVNQQLLDEFIYYDKKLTNLIQQNIIEVNSDTIIIGRNGMSLYSFEEVKKRGGKAILHSQWMHPNVQKDYLEKEYKRIGLKNEPILAERIQRQLAEIKIVDKIWCISSLVEKSYLVNNIKK